MKPFLERLSDSKLMIYDGGFGSELFSEGIELTNSALANELHPEAVVAIHSDYIESGADVVGTNTFVASELHLEMAGKNKSDVGKIVSSAVQHVKTAIGKIGKDVYIAGSIGPAPGAIEADTGDTDFGIPNQAVRDAHKRVIYALAEEGVHFLCLETIFSAKEAAIVVDIARKTGLPIAINMTYKYTKDRKTGEVVYRTDWGHSAADLLDILSQGEFSNGHNLLDDVHILGLNCGAESQRSEHTGMPYAINGIRQLSQAMIDHGIEPKRMMAYPNAGIPLLDKNHRTYYTQGPEEMLSDLDSLISEDVYLVGGCCGTTPLHIKGFRQALDVN